MIAKLWDGQRTTRERYLNIVSMAHGPMRKERSGSYWAHFHYDCDNQLLAKCETGPDGQIMYFVRLGA